MFGALWKNASKCLKCNLQNNGFNNKVNILGCPLNWPCAALKLHVANGIDHKTKFGES